MYRAYHHWMADYCGANPNRLGGVILAGARDIDGALAEIRRWGRASWAWGLMVYAPVGVPLDHPALEPLYAEAAELDLAVVLHTFTVMPPYAPGGQDTWDNLWLQRSTAHPWCGMRNMAAMIGSRVMDRYPTLRVGTLEAGHGWLPFWMARLDEHAETIKAALPELGHKPSEYVTGGRYFQSIEIPEGARLAGTVKLARLPAIPACVNASGWVVGWDDEPARARYAGYRFPAEIISHAVWLYFRFPLGLRMVEELLAARGIIVSHETVRQWALKFGQQFANQIRRRLPRVGDKWHLDEVALKIAGVKHWLWQAVDQTGHRSRCSGPTPTRQASCQAVAAQAAEEADAAATRHDH